MPNKLIFKAETLTPVIQDVKKNACELWFLADDGIYLTASTATFIRKMAIEVTDSGFIFTARQRDTEEKSC